MTFTDVVDVIPGLYIGSHPEPDDPFELGANVVVSVEWRTGWRNQERGS